MSKIKYLIMDVDGTLTDGKIYMSAKGEEYKAFNIKDGLGIHDILIPKGITPIIITGRESDILIKRCNELGIQELFQNVQDKMEKLKSILQEKQGSLNEVAYIGDDLNDIICMNKIREHGGIVGCPSNAIDAVKKIAMFISKYSGGDGAVREFIEWLICQKLN